MPIMNCTECGHDVSSSAVACPNCGKPLNNPAPMRDRPVIVDNGPKEDGIPPWAFVTGGIAAVLIVFFIIVMINRDDDNSDNTNLRVRVGSEQDRDRIPDTTTTTVTSDRSTTPIDPGVSSAPASVPSSETTVPGSQTDVSAPPTKGAVKIDAKIVTDNGEPQAVRNEKFYLLEKDVSQILSEARIEPIAGNNLANSFGLAIMYPDRYGDFRRKALEAINNNIEYSGTTDSQGKAEMTGVEPGRYYLFGITKTDKGFAMWSSQVSVNAGDNVLNLAPQRINAIKASE